MSARDPEAVRRQNRWDRQEAHPARKAVAAGPHGWVQWKGTDVCMDLHCICGAHGHVDADFVYTVKCHHCGRVYDVAGDVLLVEVPPEEHDDGSYFEPFLFADDGKRAGAEAETHSQHERRSECSAGVQALAPEMARMLLALEKVEHPGGYSDRCPVCDTDFDRDADSGPREGPPEGQVHRADCKLGALCDKLRELAKVVGT